jgi:hypothetical protein
VDPTFSRIPVFRAMNIRKGGTAAFGKGHVDMITLEDMAF